MARQLGPAPLPGLLDIAPYVPGKSGQGRKMWKLSSNESALGASPHAIAAAKAAADDLHLYPDGAARDLKAAIAEVEELEAERVIIGSGSDEVLQLLMRAYAGPEDDILQSAHGFSYYAIAAAAVRVGTIFAPERDLHTDVDAILSAVTPSVKLVFIANPNSPTGTALQAQEIRRLRQELPSNIMLVLDGAYAEYMTQYWYTTGRDLVDQSIENGLQNVIMTRTFSKIYGLGGARVGWGYAGPAVISLLERIRPPFNITVPSLKAAEAAIQDQDFVVKNRGYTVEMRDATIKTLKEWGMNVVPAFANFATLRMASAEDAQRYMQHLEADGVIIRSAKSSRLPEYVRVTIGPEDAMADFMRSTETYLAR